MSIVLGPLAIELLLLAAAPGEPGAAAGAPPEVRYAAKVVTKSWQPLELADIERMIEAKALAPLLAPGTMRLARSSYADLTGADYSLTIDGRFIEEAEKFSVYLTFGPGKRSDLPSFHVSDTEALGGLPPAVMQQKIEALSERAGRRLAEVLSPRLQAVRLEVAPPPIEEPSLPWEWGPIEAPRVTARTKSLEDLLDVSRPDHQRQEALQLVKGQVFDQPAVRDAVVLCLLRDPLPALRAACGEALVPVARTHVPTQRLILHAMRTDVDDGVLAALTEVSKDFVGLSRKECIETWLELAASDATPPASASRIAQALGEEGDVPNLDLAVAKCLQQEALAYGKKHACAQWLLRVIPEARRSAVVWRYLEKVAVWDQGENNVFGEVKEGLVRGRKVDAPIAELFLSIAERRSAGLVRDDALYVAMEHPKPTPALLERVLRLAHEPSLTSASTRAVSELVRTAPELRELAMGALRTLVEEGPRVRQKYGGDPREELREALERLERSKRP